jgi:cell division protein FtsW
MARTLKSDKWLFLATLLLVGTSIVMVYSASSFLAMTSRKFQSPYYFLFKQLAWAVLGMVVLGVSMRIDYRIYKQPAVIWAALGVVFRADRRALQGKINGTSRWFQAGPMSFQPSELAKITLAILPPRCSSDACIASTR